MIHYYCDGSYASYLKTIGCGVVRKDGENISHFFYYEPVTIYLDNHEEYAIYQTLLLIEEDEAKQTTIFNDNPRVIGAITNPRSNKRQESNIVKIRKKIEELEKQGYRIKLKFKTERESEYIQMAHRYSRKYLRNDTIRKNLTLAKEKNISLHDIQYCIDKSCRVKTEEKEEIQKKAMQKNENEINKPELRKSKAIIFKKISKTKWAAFNEKGTILCVSSDMIAISTRVLESYLSSKDVAVVNREFKKCLSTYLYKGNVTNEHYKGIRILKKWEKEQKIAYVS